jgi:hypothetical protein
MVLLRTVASPPTDAVESPSAVRVGMTSFAATPIPSSEFEFCTRPWNSNGVFAANACRFRTNASDFCADPSIVVNPIDDCCNVELKPMIAFFAPANPDASAPPTAAAAVPASPPTAPAIAPVPTMPLNPDVNRDPTC